MIDSKANLSGVHYDENGKAYRYNINGNKYYDMDEAFEAYEADVAKNTRMIDTSSEKRTCGRCGAVYYNSDDMHEHWEKTHHKEDEEVDFNVDVKMQDAVNHPSHYTNGKIECIDAIESAVTGLNGFEGYCTGNAIKYLFRWKNKGGTQDLKKANWYINKVLENNK